MLRMFEFECHAFELILAESLWKRWRAHVPTAKGYRRRWWRRASNNCVYCTIAKIHIPYIACHRTTPILPKKYLPAQQAAALHSVALFTLNTFTVCLVHILCPYISIPSFSLVSVLFLSALLFCVSNCRLSYLLTHFRSQHF